MMKMKAFAMYAVFQKSGVDSWTAGRIYSTRKEAVQSLRNYNELRRKTMKACGAWTASYSYPQRVVRKMVVDRSKRIS